MPQYGIRLHRGVSGKWGLDTCFGIDRHDPNDSEPPAAENGHHSRESFPRLLARLLLILHVSFRRSRHDRVASSDRLFDRLRPGLVPRRAPGVLPIPAQTGEAVKRRSSIYRRVHPLNFIPRPAPPAPITFSGSRRILCGKASSSRRLVQWRRGPVLGCCDSVLPKGPLRG